MADWFRSYHGAPVDPKWGVIARKAGVARSLVVALAWLLLDIASRARPRGSLAAAVPEEIAVQLDCEQAQVEAVLLVMREPDPASGKARFIGSDNVIPGWSKRQPSREREGGADLLSTLGQAAMPGQSPGGANPPAGAIPANASGAAMPASRSIRPANLQDVVGANPTGPQKTTSNQVRASGNHARATSSQSPPLSPPAPPLTTPEESNLYITPIPTLSPPDEVDAARVAVWRAARRSELWISSRFVSTSREGIADVQRWLGLGLSVEQIGAVACDVLGKARGDVGRPFRYIDDAVMRKAAEGDAPEVGQALPVDFWDERVGGFRHTGMWLGPWGAPPGDADCAAPLAILSKHGFTKGESHAEG